MAPPLQALDAESGKGRENRRSWTRLGLAGGVVLAGFAASLAANYPGHFTPDSVWQLAQGRSGIYDFWHPPVMAWMLGVAARLGYPGPLFILFDATLYYGGVLAFLTLEGRPRAASLVVAALVFASPIVLIYQGMVWKDVMFADVSMAGFAALAWAARRRRRGVVGWLVLAPALALFSLAALARQNGAVVPVCALAAIFAIAWTGEVGEGRHDAGPAKAAVSAITAAALIAAVIAAASLALAERGNGQPETARQIERLRIFDLAGAARAEPTIDLSALRRRDRAMETFVRGPAAANWRAAGADYLLRLPGGSRRVTADGEIVARQWWAFLLRHPLLYLRVRSQAYAAVVLTRNADACAKIDTGVDLGGPEFWRGSGMQARYTTKDEWDEDYASRFLTTPVFSHVLYGALAIALLVWAAADLCRRQPRPDLIVVAAMLTSALLFAASFFVISNACDYRYLYFLDVAAMTALIHRLAIPATRLRQPAAT